MDQAQALDALASVISDLSEKPYDISLHAKHITIAQSLGGMDSEVLSAMETLTQCLAASEDVWLFLLDKKEKSLDLNTSSGIEELLALYERAEEDYLSIPVLQRHLEFLLDQHAKYDSGEELRSTDFEEMFTTEWTRDAITGVVNKGIGHLTQSHLLWNKQLEWELAVLEATPEADRSELVANVQKMLLNRLRQPHTNSEGTLQMYSTFTTNYKPPDQYESLLVAASKARSHGDRGLERRENLEAALVQSAYSLDVYAHYVTVERRAKYPDVLLVSTTYERAIAEAARRRFNGEEDVEHALRIFWAGYCDSLRILDVNWDVQLAIIKRATRSVPGSGEIWARYVRLQERLEDLEVEADSLLNVEDIFNLAFDTKLIQQDVDQVVAVTQARADYERRRLEVGSQKQKQSAEQDTLTTLIGVLEAGVQFVYSASKTGDVKLRLENYLVEIYERVGLIESAIGVWQSATKVNKSSYLVWKAYVETLKKHQMYDQARAVFEDIHKKHLDWPEMIWELWSSFEHLHGTVDQVDGCLDKIEKAQAQVNAKRAKEAAKVSYQAIQEAPDSQTIPLSDTHVDPSATIEDDRMIVADKDERGTKRAAEEDVVQDAQKKSKTELPQAPLKRDRENCTVFVSDLPKDATEDDLVALFKNCGEIREIKITELPETFVSTVEFNERDSILAALTKDKKRVRGQEVAVHLAWKSTLYVTNFPESYDDAAVRKMFDEYGTILEVRWPSKRLKNTRRFCYVQYTSPQAAEKALELHGQQLQSDHPLNVFISNPERRKARTDQNADDKELYVAGLSKFTTEADLEKIFKTYGSLKAVRLAKDENGQAKGYAFIEFEQEESARLGLGANNHELRKRRIGVTMANSNVRSRHRGETPDSGLGRTADARSRSIRVRNLPPNAQEGLLQQMLEKIAAVKQVEVFMDKQEALVELTSAAEAGRLLLNSTPVQFGNSVLQFSEEPTEQPRFVPRRAGPSRPRAGLGHVKGSKSSGKGSTNFVESQDIPSQGKGQDDFRKMLTRQ